MQSNQESPAELVSLSLHWYERVVTNPGFRQEP
jgi:hypothetical protein